MYDRSILRRPTFFVLASLVLFVAGSVPAAHAYVRHRSDAGAELFWCDSAIGIELHVRDGVPNITRDEMIGAATAAASAWSSPPATGCASALKVQVTDTSAPGPGVVTDHRNSITFWTDFWGWHGPLDEDEVVIYPYDALALTTLTYTGDGKILDADLEINAANPNRTWTWAVSTAANQYDLQATLTHEIGHVVGLDHTCALHDGEQVGLVDNLGNAVPVCDLSSTAPRGTMYPQAGGNMRVLSPDEDLASCDLYPPGASSPCASAGGCCAIAGRDDPAGGGGLLVLAVALMSWRSRRRSLGEPLRPDVRGRTHGGAVAGADDGRT